MRNSLAILAVSLCLGLVASAWAEVVVLDDFESLDAWRVITPDGVSAKVSLADGVEGHALRLDFNFERGGGFCVVRRDIALDLPANYRFAFSVRGDAQPNNLEFKLIDNSGDNGDNVWWVNRWAFEFPTQWQQLTQKARQFRFAWGPSGGQRLEKIGAIEFAVAAASGGKGSVYLDQLTFEELPAPEPVTHTPLVTVSTGGSSKPVELDESGRLDWRSDTQDRQPTLNVDFQQMREIGGLRIEWDADDFARAYDVSVSMDGQQWEPVAHIAGSYGGRDYVRLPDVEGRALRIDVRETSRARGVGVQTLRLLDGAFSESPNSMFQVIAAESPRGWFPLYFLNQQQFWTIVGADLDDKEALIDAAGAIELDKGGCRLEPFLHVDGKLVTWADAALTQSLADDYLPIPSVTWRAGDLELEITALAAGEPGASTCLARYCVRNHGSKSRDGALFLALRPFQVLPSWQTLNVVGGTASAESITGDAQRAVINGKRIVRPWTTPNAFGATSFAQGDIVEYLAAGRVPSQTAANDPAKLASGAWQYAFALPPGGEQTVVVEAPFYDTMMDLPANASAQDVAARFAKILDQVTTEWAAKLNRVQILLPPSAARLVNTFRTTQAYIFINADGPRIQPGSRTYERSWIRDGAMTSAALLYTDHTDRVRAFIDWYAPFQYDNGKVPCVVDSRGGDPVPEHDSMGELIYLIANYYRFTHDRDALQQHLSQVVKSVDYIEELRSQRLTDEYRNGPPEKRACYGLVTESGSHEGYLSHPMHSYWDSFFVMRGLKDARLIAQVLGRADLEQRFGKLVDDYRRCFYDSIRLAMQNKHVEYVPGCVELGDFDATSTAIGIYPCQETDYIPQPALTNTFDRYYDFFQKREAGTLEWRDFTPYEVRIIAAYILLGQPERAQELVDFFFQYQHPAGWNHWAEVAYRDPATPGYIGDMPHTWVGSGFVNAVRTMFVYERESDDALVLAAGVKPEWVRSPEGVAIKDFPTPYGRVSYRLRADGDAVVLELAGGLTIPPGGVVVCPPMGGQIRGVEVDGQAVKAFGPAGVRIQKSPATVRITYGP